MKKIEHTFIIMSNVRLTEKTFLMELQVAENKAEVALRPGQFVNILVDGNYLRRPISVCDYEDGLLTLLYDVVGEGTEKMSRWEAGREVNLLAPLGNGFDISRGGDSPLLLGGGIGIAPLYMLAKELLKQGKKPCVILGFNSARDAVCVDEFKALGVPTHVATVAGDMGAKGFVTDVAECHSPEHEYFYACGPMPMLKALSRTLKIDGELSLDERMACGFGVCRCCTCEISGKPERICKEGPVFSKQQVLESSL